MPWVSCYKGLGECGFRNKCNTNLSTRERKRESKEKRKEKVCTVAHHHDPNELCVEETALLH